MQAPQQTHNFQVHRGQAGFDNGFLAQSNDILVHLLVHLEHDFFNPRWMNASIRNEPHHRLTGNLAADWVEPGQEDCAGSIIDEDGDTRSGLKSANVSAFAANDATFYVIARQSD